MSLYDYKESQEIAAHDYGFFALIMAAMRKADTNNSMALKQAFPLTFAELQEHYNAPEGVIESDGNRS